jgi:hypothetical protein
MAINLETVAQMRWELKLQRVGIFGFLKAEPEQRGPARSRRPGSTRASRAVIVENGVANGARMRGMHTEQSWQKFRAPARRDGAGPPTASARMIHRFDMFEMPKALQVNLLSNDSPRHFTADTALGFFTFRPEEFAAAIAPRPLLILYSARDT